jgi:hypothetical protein
VVDDLQVKSAALPGGDLVAAALDRQVMALADRGGASGLVGQRWSDHCASFVSGWSGGLSDVPDGGAPIVVSAVARLDAEPRIARAASKRGLQNPDFLILGTREGRPCIQAADAKFSVETARPRQVSAEVVEGLLAIAPLLERVTGPLDPEAALVPGFFLSPDYTLTSVMLRRRYGIVKVSVREEEVERVPVEPATFWIGLEGAAVMQALARVDALPVMPDESLLAGLYYFRLARAVVGGWLDNVRPLLPHNDRTVVDEAAVVQGVVDRARHGGSAWQLALDWDADVERTRAQRQQVEHVAGLPIINRELRELILRVSAEVGAEPPSMNSVRRRLGHWFRGEVRDRVGPLDPPVEHLPRVLREVGAAAAAVAPRLMDEATRIVLEQLAAATDPDPDGIDNGQGSDETTRGEA